MKKSSEPCETPSNRSELVRQPLNRFAMTAFVAAVGLLTLSWPAEARVVYTPVNATISGNGSIRIDLNHDTIIDFVILSTSELAVCGNRGGVRGSTKFTPKTGNGVVVSHLTSRAELLARFVPIGSGNYFYNAETIITDFLICYGGFHNTKGYLGLEFQINGQTHYGWAQVNISASYYSTPRMTTTLVDFAYETIPGKTVITGQTFAAAEEDVANPEN